MTAALLDWGTIDSDQVGEHYARSGSTPLLQSQWLGKENPVQVTAFHRICRRLPSGVANEVNPN